MNNLNIFDSKSYKLWRKLQIECTPKFENSQIILKYNNKYNVSISY